MARPHRQVRRRGLTIHSSRIRWAGWLGSSVRQYMTDRFCPGCGALLVLSISEGSRSVSCSECSWAVTTTNYDLPQWDKTQYRIRLVTTNGHLAKAAACVAAELGITGRQALQILRDGQQLGTMLTAMDVLRIDSKLTPQGFCLSTEPPFPWGLTGGGF